MTTALLFPGQGLQYVGMGRSLVEQSAAARRVFEEADDAAGFSLGSLCFDGPDDQLVLTRNAQPAILAHSIAALAALRDSEDVAFDAVVGHSLGEFSALVAAGSLGLSDAIRLVQRRGELMQEATAPGVGAMAAVLGLDADKIAALCAAVCESTGQDVVVATINGATNIVISGDADAVNKAADAAREAGAMSVRPLAVSAPFHSPLMQPAAEGLAAALEDVTFSEPNVAVWSTVTADVYADAASMADVLVRQVCAPVRWAPTIEAMSAAGTTNGIALGPAKSLKGMVRRIVRGLKVRVVAEI